MGRLSAKFNPLKMAQTAKKLEFGEFHEEQREKRDGEEGLISFQIQSNAELVLEKEKRKRYCGSEEEQSLKGIAVSGESAEKTDGEIRLFGKNIKYEQGESSGMRKGESSVIKKGEVERVYTLGDLLSQKSVEMNKGKVLAINKKALAVSQYTAVTRDSLSHEFAVLEGQGDNCAGTHRSPTKIISQLFAQYMGCFSPMKIIGETREIQATNQTFEIVENGHSSRAFSFVSPTDDFRPYDPVEEWWPRRASPSLQYSVTAVDPIMERHPVWMERYGGMSQITQYGVCDDSNGDKSLACESFTFPK